MAFVFSTFRFFLLFPLLLMYTLFHDRLSSPPLSLFWGMRGGLHTTPTHTHAHKAQGKRDSIGISSRIRPRTHPFVRLNIQSVQTTTVSFHFTVSPARKHLPLLSPAN